MEHFDPQTLGTLKFTIAQPKLNIPSVCRKLSEDIAFLESQIQRMKASNSPRSSVLNAYTLMLKERQSALSWLHEDHAPSVELHSR